MNQLKLKKIKVSDLNPDKPVISDYLQNFQRQTQSPKTKQDIPLLEIKVLCKN